jgi:branched-chain amino acid transport system permease protein
LLSAIGASIFLQNLVMLVVGRDTQPFPQLSDFTGLAQTHWDIGSIRLLYIEPLTLFAALGLMVALDLFVSRTRLGKGMRATAQDPEAAMMLGIPVNRVITTTFVVGSALAAAAGILYGLRYGGVKFNDGFIIGLKAFVAAVLGGIGNIRGAMLGGFLLGLSETVVIATMEFGWEGLGARVDDDDWPKAEFHDYKDAIAFLILVAVLSFRPSGLLGAPEIEKV